MQNKQWIQGLQSGPAQATTSYNYAYGVPAQYAPQAPPTEEWLPEAPQEQKRHPVLKGTMWTFAILALFCLSVAAGMLSDGRRPNADNVLRRAAKGEVQSATTEASHSGLQMAQSLDVNQAQGAENVTTLTSDSPFYQYKDKLGDIDVTVSRQPLPNDIKGDSQGLSKLVASIGSPNQQLPTAKWGTAYLLSSPSAQIAVFANDRTLVFVQSLQPRPAADWKTYIDNLVLQ
jgi:hypothetical protein